MNYIWQYLLFFNFDLKLFLKKLFSGIYRPDLASGKSVLSLSVILRNKTFIMTGYYSDEFLFESESVKLI